jgi:hypothetical protein
MKLVWGIKNGRLTRSAGMVALGVSAMLVSACSASSAAQNGNSAPVTLSPASGSENGTPTWSTTSACPSGYQGSAILRAIRANGTTFSLSPATNEVTAPFKGTLLASVATIQDFGDSPNGSTQKWVVICFSGPSLTGTGHDEMSLFVTYSSDGESYKSGSTS